MRRFALILAVVLLAAWGFASAHGAGAASPATGGQSRTSGQSPQHDAAVNLMKQKLGAAFTVKRVGVLVVAWDLDAEVGAAYEKFIQDVQDALYKDLFVKRPTGVFKVALFRDTASLQKNAKKLAVKSVVMPMGGFYLPYERVICADMTGGRWVVQHEITHALLHADLGRENWPASTVTPWVDEGIASLVESAPLKDGSFQIGPDWRLTMACRRADGGLPKLRDVMTMDFATYNSPKNRFLNDVVARTFLLFLHERGQFLPFYKAYRTGVAADPSGIKAVEKTVQKSLDEIEADWLAWLKTKAEPVAPAKPESGTSRQDSPAVGPRSLLLIGPMGPMGPIPPVARQDL